MRAVIGLVVCATFAGTPAAAADALAEARRLYNLGQYDSAATLAREALEMPTSADGARLVLGRVHLERFRRTADPADLVQAREALRTINAELLDRRERAELTIGLGEALFLDDRFGAASELFERALDTSPLLGPAAHERVLDWWASAVDRLALTRPREVRQSAYERIIARMEQELSSDSSSAPAAYWLAAASRGAGNLDRAWNAAVAAWVTATLARDRGAALRADLDRLMLQGIIPDRAARLSPRDPKSAGALMVAEWEAFKAGWTR